MEPLALYYHPAVLEHETGAHPEHPSRLRAIVDALEQDGLTRVTPLREPAPATATQITRIHATGYVATIDRISRGGGGQIESDTVASAGSYRAATLAAGGAIEATQAVLTGEARRAFSLGRPPGHHARPAAAMGFCLFNNVAIAAREAQAIHGIGRIAIVDVDVHHGNGTQESFYEDPTILYVSVHQSPFYPGTGNLAEVGSSAGRGTTLNVPMPAGSGDAEYLAVTDAVVLPALRRFAPELLLLSFGYDGHWNDPLAYMQLTISGYVAIVERMALVADELCEGRLALVLEGGYDLSALAGGVVATARALRGDPWSDPLGPPSRRLPHTPIDTLIATARRVHSL